MEIRFYEDPDTGLPHIYGHDVTEDEVRRVLRSRGEDLPRLFDFFKVSGTFSGSPAGELAVSGSTSRTYSLPGTVGVCQSASGT